MKIPEGTVIANGFDDAFMGVDYEGRAVYDAEKMVDILVERDGMEYDEAREFLQFNTWGAYVGEMTPIYVFPEEEDDS